MAQKITKRATETIVRPVSAAIDLNMAGTLIENAAEMLDGGDERAVEIARRLRVCLAQLHKGQAGAA